MGRNSKRGSKPQPEKDTREIKNAGWVCLAGKHGWETFEPGPLPDLKPSLLLYDKGPEGVSKTWAYWVMAEEMGVVAQTRLLRLLCVAFRGDPVVADPSLHHPLAAIKYFRGDLRPGEDVLDVGGVPPVVPEGPMFYQASADESAPWTSGDRAMFEQNPQIECFWRWPHPDEVADIAERPRYDERLRVIQEKFPGRLGILVVKVRGGRVREPVVFQGDGPEPYPFFLTEHGDLEPFTQEALETYKKAAEDPSTQEYLDFCATCGQEIPFGGIEFTFDEPGPLKNHCYRCTSIRIEALNVFPSGLGLRLPNAPPEEWSKEVHERFKVVTEVLKESGFMERLKGKTTHEQREALGQLAGLKPEQIQ